MPDYNLTGGANVVRPPIALDLTDGDTFKRFTVTDTFVTQYSRILCSVSRASTAEIDDQGWNYVVNVAYVTSGSFDVNVCALMMGETPINGESPNETLTLYYSIQ